MKIALLSAANNVHTMRWANAMSELGHEVTVISSKSHKPNLQLKYCDAIKIVFLGLPSPYCYFFSANQLKRIIKKENFDIVNIHYASGYGTLGRKAKLKNALLNLWGSDVYVFPYKNSFNMRTVKKNLRYYNQVASTSRCMALQAKKLIDREYRIIPFGVDTRKFKLIEGLKPQDRIIFGTVKALSAVYGLADTIKAFSRLVGRLEKEGLQELEGKLVYEIYGKGEQEEELKRLIDSLGMSEKIKLCGYVENSKLPEILNTFTVFNCNSLSESFGVAVVEAMACGIPVQVSSAEGFVEVVEDGVTGLISPIGDVDAICDNMYRLLMDENLRKSMATASIERVKKLYNWTDNVKDMETLYKAIVEAQQ